MKKYLKLPLIIHCITDSHNFSDLNTTDIHYALEFQWIRHLGTISLVIHAQDLWKNCTLDVSWYGRGKPRLEYLLFKKAQWHSWPNVSGCGKQTLAFPFLNLFLSLGLLGVWWPNSFLQENDPWDSKTEDTAVLWRSLGNPPGHSHILHMTQGSLFQ